MIFYSRFFSVFVIFITSLSSLLGQTKQIPAVYNFYTPNKGESGQSSILDSRIRSDMSVTEVTAILQKFINQNSVIVLPDREIVVSPTGISLGDDKTLIFQKRSRLRIQSNSLEEYGIINIIDSRNVKIYNAHLIGDRYQHESSKGEWGMGIRILGASNVLVDNFYIQQCWGDGIYIGRNKDIVSQGITIKNGVVIDNRRNGISVTSINGLNIEKVTSAYTNGTSPQFGIDFEANNAGDEMNNIVLNDIVTYYNNNGGMMLSFDRISKKSKNRTIKEVNFSITDYKDVGSKDVGILIAQITKGANDLKGKITINGIEVVQNRRPILIRRNELSKFKIVLSGVNIKAPVNKNFHNGELLRVHKDKTNVSIRLKK